MRSSYRRPPLFFLVAAALLLPVQLFSQAGSRPEPVLMIHSYHYTLAWSRAIQTGVDDALRGSSTPIEVYVEWMDAKRLPEGLETGRFAEYLEDKYRDVSFEVVMVSDNPALEFAVSQRDALFPDATLVFSGIDHPAAEAHLLTLPRVTGVVEGIDLAANLDFALALWPKTESVYILGDRTEVAEDHRNSIRSLASTYAGQLEFEFLVPSSADAMRSQVEALPPNSVLFYLHFHYTETDGFLAFERIIPDIAAASPVPTLGAWDFSIGYGLAAGYVTNGRFQGMYMAKMARQILEGAPLSAVPPLTTSPNTYMVNYPELDRHGANKAALPEEAVRLNHVPGLLERSLPVLIGSVAVVLFLSTVLGILLVNNRRRRRSESRALRLNEELQRGLEERSTLMREAHHRIKNNLQVLESIISLERGKIASNRVSPAEALLSIQKRCRAIGLVHKHLYRSSRFASVSLSAYLGDLLEQLRDMLDAGGSSTVSIEQELADIEVDMETAVPLGLILGELVSNSLKHAGGHGPEVLIRVVLTGNEDGPVELTARDNGPGYDETAQVDSLGLSLIRALAEQIGAELRLYNDRGAVSRLRWNESTHRERKERQQDEATRSRRRGDNRHDVEADPARSGV